MGLDICVFEVLHRWNPKGERMYVDEYRALRQKFRKRIYEKRWKYNYDFKTPFRKRGLKPKEWFYKETKTVLIDDMAIEANIYFHYKTEKETMVHSKEFKKSRKKLPVLNVREIGYVRKNTRSSWYRIYDYLSDNLFEHVWKRFLVLLNRKEAEHYIKWFARDKEMARERILDKMNDENTFVIFYW